MVNETLVNELLRVLRAIDAEKEAAKEDAKEHKDRIDELMDEAQGLRARLEGDDRTLFDEEGEGDAEPQRMTALDDTARASEEPPGETDEPDGALADRAYEAGAQARLEGRPESDCPYLEDTYLGRSWLNGWREFEDLDKVPEEGAES